MSHTIQDKPKLMARVRRIQGQAAALEKNNWKMATIAAHPATDCRHPRRGQRPAGRGDRRHITHHLVLEADEAQRRDDLDVVLQVIRSYVK